MYKLVVLDVDDTLLNSQGVIPAKVRAAIAHAKEAGVIVTVATGRGFLGSKRFVDEIGAGPFVINYGGSQITNALTGEIVSVDAIPMPLVREVVEFARTKAMHVQVYDGDDYVYDEDNKWSEYYASFLGFKGRAAGNLLAFEWQTPKILCIDEAESIQHAIPEFAERFAGRLGVSTSKAHYIELNNLGSNKGKALEKLAGVLGIQREEIIAIGDNMIDKAMIEYAGLGVCVENGAEAVKAVASFIAPSNDECGVAHVIEKFVLCS